MSSKKVIIGIIVAALAVITIVMSAVTALAQTVTIRYMASESSYDYTNKGDGYIYFLDVDYDDPNVSFTTGSDFTYYNTNGTSTCSGFIDASFEIKTKNAVAAGATVTLGSSSDPAVVLKVTKGGYTSDGDYVDVVITVSQVTIQNFGSSAVNTCIMEGTKGQDLLKNAIWMDAYVTSNVQSSITVSIYYTGTNTLAEGYDVIWQVVDLDQPSHTSSSSNYGGSYTEGIAFVSGFDNPVYLLNGTYLVQSTKTVNGQTCTWLRASQGDSNTLYSGFMTTITTGEFSFVWTGSSCGTKLRLTTGDYASPTTSSPTKAVSQSVVDRGESYTYTITAKIPYTLSGTNSYSSISLSDTFDSAIDISSATVTVRRTDVLNSSSQTTDTSNWSVSKSGQTITVTHTSPSNAGGTYVFTISGVKVKSNADLSSYTVTQRSGNDHYVINNTATLRTNSTSRTSNTVSVYVPIAYVNYVLMSTKNPSSYSSLPSSVTSYNGASYTVASGLTTSVATNGDAWYFNGWYYDEDLTQRASGTITLTTGTTTLYGAWEYSYIGIDKSVSTNYLEDAYAGNEITYSFTISNEGNTTLFGLIVVDNMLPDGTVLRDSSGATVGTFSNGRAATELNLTEGSSITLYATYAVTQSDIDGQWVNNTAQARATDWNDVDVYSTEDSEAVEIKLNPDVSLTKTASTTFVENAAAGSSQVTYTLVVTNTGNTTLHGIVLTDEMLGGTITSYLDKTTIAPNESAIASVTYTLTQDDIDGRYFTNYADVEAYDPVNTQVTDEDDVTVEAECLPEIALDKTSSTTYVRNAVAGSTAVVYYFEVTNTGNMTLDNVIVTDTLLGGTVSIEKTTLAPGESTTGSATYVLTQSNINNASVYNYAQARGTDRQNTTVYAADAVTVGIETNSEITLTKTANVTYIEDAEAGVTEITYSFVVTNVGNTTLYDTYLSDDMLGGQVLLDKATLSPGDVATGTATYVLTQADIDATTVYNYATVTANSPSNTAVSATDDETVTIKLNSDIDLVKTASAYYIEDAEAGVSEVVYEFVVTNTGNSTLYDVKVTDEKINFELMLNSSLAPGEYRTLTASYILTQDDIDGKYVTNYASVVGYDSTGSSVTDDDDVTIETEWDADVELTKSGVEVIENPIAGETIMYYTIVVENTGNVSLYDVSVAEALDVTWDINGQSAYNLAPGESNTHVVSYVLTQSDIDAGRLTNFATTTTYLPNGGDGPGSSTSITTRLVSNPSIVLEKTANVELVENAEAGVSEVVYSFTVTNTGNTTLHNIIIEDQLVSDSFFIEVEKTTLAPSESTTATATYVVTQEDIDTESIYNVATVYGVDPSNYGVSATDDVTVYVEQLPDIDVVKSGTEVIEDAYAGDEIEFTILITNTGNVTLVDINVDDTLDGVTLDYTNAKMTLAPDESMEVVASYVLTQEDIDSGSVTNYVYVTGNTWSGTSSTWDDDDATTKLLSNPSISLVKTANVSLVESAEAGVSEVVYTFTVQNTGNTTLSDIVLTDEMLGGEIELEKTTLAPNESTVATATYVVTQEDIDAGLIENVATIEGDDPHGTTTTSTGTWAVEVEQLPDIDLYKDVVGNTVISRAKAGTTVRFAITVQNIGNTTLTDIVISDLLSGATFVRENISGVTFGSNTVSIASMSPADSVTVYVDYTLTQADINRGDTKNIATVTAITPNGDEINDGDDAQVETPSEPDISVIKTANVEVIEGAVTGDTVYYTITITNVGNTTISDLSLYDELLGGDLSELLEVTVLDPSESTVVMLSYDVTQEDVDSGEVTNIASATGYDPHGTEVTNEGSVSVELTSVPSISLEKSADVSVLEGAYAGDEITYTFVITNTGNTTISNLTLVDELLGGDIAEYLDTTVIAPGVTATASVVYVLTQEDIDAESVTNNATASGTDPHGTEVTGEDGYTVEIIGEPSILLTKEASTSVETADLAVGDEITYVFTIVNDGNQTLTNVTLADDMFGGEIELDVTTLLPNEEVSVEIVYEITQDDLNNGNVYNTATASGIAPNGDELTSDAEVTVYLPQNPAISVTKTADVDTIEEAEAGNIIMYTVEVVNTGDVSLQNISVVDELYGIVMDTTPLSDLILLPGESVTLEAEYSLVQKDIEAEYVHNHAVVTAESVVPYDVNNEWTHDGTVTADDDAIVTVVPLVVVEEETECETVECEVVECEEDELVAIILQTGSNSGAGLVAVIMLVIAGVGTGFVIYKRRRL